MAVTPVWTASPSVTVACPTATPRTSTSALSGPVGKLPMTIPASRARGRSPGAGAWPAADAVTGPSTTIASSSAPIPADTCLAICSPIVPLPVPDAAKLGRPALPAQARVRKQRRRHWAGVALLRLEDRRGSVLHVAAQPLERLQLGHDLGHACLCIGGFHRLRTAGEDTHSFFLRGTCLCIGDLIGAYLVASQAR